MGKRTKDQRQSNIVDNSPMSNKRSRPPKHHQKEEKLILSNLNSKILKEVLNQQKEIIEEEKMQNLNSFSSIAEDPITKLDGDGEEDEEEDFDGFSETLSQYDSYQQEIDEEDERILEAFMSKDAGPQSSLADLII